MRTASNFPEFLNWAIADRKLSVNKIAARLRESGYSVAPSTLTRWRNGKTVPTLKNYGILKRLPDILSLSAIEKDTYDAYLAAYIGEKESVHHQRTLPYRKHFVGGQVTYFVGRHAERTQLQAAITRRQIVLISGMGGAGKTTLAWQVMEENVRSFAQGYDSIRLAPQHHAFDVVRRVAQQLGLPDRIDDDEYNMDAALEQLRGWVQGSEVLFLLDDVTSLEQIRPLILALPIISWIITSRRHLFAADLNLYPLRLTLPLFADAAAMLRHHAGMVNVDSEQENVQIIVERLGSLPIALRVAGRLVSHRYVANLEQLANWLTTQGTVVLQMGDWSLTTFFDRLAALVPTADALVLLQICGAFAEPHIDYAALVATATYVDCSVAALHYLMDVSLVEWGEDAKSLQLHPLIHEYAGHKLAENATQAQILEGFARYFAEYARQHRGQLVPLHAQIHNLQAAANDYIQANNWRQLLPLWRAISGYLWRISDWEAYLAFDMRCLAVAQANEEVDIVGEISAEIGYVHLEMGAFTEAHTFFTQALTIAQTQNDLEAEARLYRYFGILHTAEERLLDAMAALQQAEEIVNHAQSADGILAQWMSHALALIYHAKAKIYQLQHDFASAQTALEHALQFDLKSDGTASRAIILLRLGSVLVAREQYVQARKVWRDLILNYQQSHNEMRVIIVTVQNLVELERHLGNVEEARYWESVAKNAYAQLGLTHRYTAVQTLWTELDDEDKIALDLVDE